MMRALRVLIAALLLGLVAVAVTYVAAPATFVAGAVTAARWGAGLHHRQLDTPGWRWHYLDSEGSGPPLLLLHGFGGDKDNWTRVARRLRGHYRIIAPDLPGYGQSDAPRGAGYGIGPQIERLHDFVTAIGLTRVHLGGNSMGGTIAAGYAARYPNEVGSLWLIDSGGLQTAPRSQMQRMAVESDRLPLVPSTAAEFHDLLGFVMSRPPVLPPAVLEVLAQRAVAAHALRLEQLADLIDEGYALEPLIRGLPIPTHILWGAQDRVVDAGGAEVLMALLPQASRTILPGIGHLPMVEDPQASATDYLAFRATLPR